MHAPEKEDEGFSQDKRHQKNTQHAIKDAYQSAQWFVAQPKTTVSASHAASFIVAVSR